MRAALFLTVLAILSTTCAGQTIRFTPADETTLLDRIADPPQTDQARAARMKQLFQEAGCSGAALSEQQITGSTTGNIICRLPGKSGEMILVGAHYEQPGAHSEFDDWNSAALLASLYQSLSHRKRHHTFVFAAFADEGAAQSGSQFLADNMAAQELRQLQAMVNLEPLGLSPTKIWTDHSDKDLVHALVVTMYALKIPSSQVDIRNLGKSDCDPFAVKQVPQITLHSLTQQNVAENAPSAFLPAHYFQSYRLISGYLAFLDESLKGKAHSK